MFVHSLGTPIINDWNLQSTMFNKKLMNITIQNVQSANGITINPTQNKSVHSQCTRRYTEGMVD